MIPTDKRSWEIGSCSNIAQKTATRPHSQPGQSKILRAVAILTTTLVLAGCTNSKLVIGPLYNRLDDQMRTEFNKLGEFNDTQVQAFEQAVGTFHVWHRQSEMPKYAELLGEIAQSIGKKEATTQADVDRWAEDLEQLAKNFRECHPVNYSIGLIQSLSDEQIDFIERRFNSERDKNRERYADQTKEERVERRLKNIVKWSGRLGLDFTTAQKKILRDSLTQQVSLRKEYYQLSSDWNQYLFLLARNQENPAYEEALSKHISKLWTLLERAHPEEWRSIRNLWQNTIFTLIGTFSEPQRKVINQWLGKMSNTVNAISKDKPSFQVSNDASHGCLVAQNN